MGEDMSEYSPAAANSFTDHSPKVRLVIAATGRWRAGWHALKGRGRDFTLPSARCLGQSRPGL